MYGKSRVDREELSIFKPIGIQRGERVVDTENLFSNDDRLTHKKLDFLPTDSRWNALVNKLVLDRSHPILVDILAK